MNLLKLCAALLACLPPSLIAADRVAIREGEPFPALHFPALADGALRTVDSFRGTKTLLLHFASW